MDSSVCSYLDFVYDDTDTHFNEIAELYSYTEQYELQLNVKAFEDQMQSYNLRPVWQNLTIHQHKSIIYKLLDQLEVSNKELRMKAARCILYLAQGCWAEVQSDKEQQEWERTNVMLLYECGIFSAFIELLNIEIENNTAASADMKKTDVSLADSTDLRVILSVLYIITEVMREEFKHLDDSIYKHNVEAFKDELINPCEDELLIVKLLGMVTCFCSGSAPYFPMKKVLLLLWKLILVSLGGMETLRELKKIYREQAGLDNLQEDTIEVAKIMRPSSPPTSATDYIDTHNSKKGSRPFRRSLLKQSSLDEPNLEYESGRAMLIKNEGGIDTSEGDVDEGAFDNQSLLGDFRNYYDNPNIIVEQDTSAKMKGLPWAPKVRQKDVDMFLDVSRLKFVGYKLQGDRDSVAGLPQPIHEGLNILKRYMYTSLSEVQIQKEEEIAKNPMSTQEPPIRQTATEILYQAMLSNLPQHVIALLKILLVAAPTSRVKADSINILSDVMPEEFSEDSVQSAKLGVDVDRHKEIIVKAVSAILLLLLKHFKLNHVYQFEFISQHLVFANCIPLILKFLNQNILSYIETKHSIPFFDFPICVIGEQPGFTMDHLPIGENQNYSWRNIFSCINLLRILNKLTKWKHSRIMMLVVFKSAPILKRTLKVMHGILQLYVLKLLKMQTKYLGRQWRKANMKTISLIYAKVRHRLNDDWAFGNDLDARPWNFQVEECTLREGVDRFNNRRYSNAVKDEELEPVDTSITSVLGANVELTDEFKQHYELWLQQEVLQTSINWDELLAPTKCIF
ncbi:PREDICTED: striatin-interacting protein 1 isoform X2 [Ceratosolen solmsi marchali]|uniref:Striatin-interacting protein 1 isoform X2 n=1 Tax=Ceratosolen solmsi marchali TaxID=326594 RepID=A0AAJ6YHP5_9HYME|nr:PREDICTED: striatin-interacting protein 1 isoform X2 [Ceratosolen solmsi marchali]